MATVCPFCIMPLLHRMRRRRCYRTDDHSSCISRGRDRVVPGSLNGAHIALSSAADRAHVTHAVLVALVAVLLARIRTLPTVVPRRDARNKPININPSS
jgi:hypothetical protein